ncbi:probable dihydrolipoyllysine-residue acetyltransferase component of pyruvate dehydrogenase complex, mitochondrial at N-terminal half [Coccomyxa sp. Obi]|nr:probable dihydrolipoyllysine-residue acetyltransferase component of pyruvate dehydrogenase complex, mitochondrial at N-terminal half [Coccomyxa sp. Obi]
MSADSSNVIVVPMPKLSPSMTEGTISRWLKAPGDEIVEYDIIMEVDTQELTEAAYKVGKFAGSVTLLVEAQEDGIMHSHLVPQGKQVKVGTPVALMAEQGQSLPDLDGYKPPENVYAEGSQDRTLIWQSYLKSEQGDETKGADQMSDSDLQSEHPAPCTLPGLAARRQCLEGRRTVPQLAPNSFCEIYPSEIA